MKTRYKIGTILELDLGNKKTYYYVYDIANKYTHRFRPMVVPLLHENSVWDGDTTYAAELHWSKKNKTWEYYGLPLKPLK